jgi:hypothetical protein
MFKGKVGSRNFCRSPKILEGFPRFLLFLFKFGFLCMHVQVCSAKCKQKVDGNLKINKYTLIQLLFAKDKNVGLHH